MKKTISLIGFLLIFIISCANNRKFSDFQIEEKIVFGGIGEDSVSRDTIRPGDILSIGIFILDSRTGELISKMGKSAAQEERTYSETSGLSIPGFELDTAGYINLNLLGKLMLAGLTTSQAKEIVLSKATKYFPSPIVELSIQSVAAAPGKQQKISTKNR